MTDPYSNRTDPRATFVFFRAEHDTNPPEMVSKALGFTLDEPGAHSHPKETATGERNPFNVWSLSSFLIVHSKDVNCHFEWLLKTIGDRGPALRSIEKEGWRLQIYCIWMGGGYGGPVLTPEILRGLADLGLHMYFDVSNRNKGVGGSEDAGGDKGSVTPRAY